MEKGSRVQAVDSLGRWEPAKILEVENEDSGIAYKVGFPGWGNAHNRHIPESKHEVRVIVDPFKEDICKYTFIYRPISYYNSYNLNTLSL